MPYIIKPGSFKYKNTNGQFSEIDCFEGPDLTEEVAALEKGKAPIIIDSAVGNPIVLKDGADGLPVEGMKIHFSPIQNLNGYNNPWPAGGGKNKLSVDIDVAEGLNSGFTRNGNTLSRNGIDFTFNDDGTIKVNGTATGNYSYLTLCEATFLSDSPSGTYVLNGCPSGGAASKYNIDVAGASGCDTGNGISLTYTGTLTNVAVRIRVTENTTVNNLIFKPMIRLASVTDDTFAPYSNICPIEGWSKVTANRTGKNLLPNKKYQYSATQVRLGGENSTEAYKKLKAGTYTLSVTGNVNVQCYCTHNGVNTLLGSNGGTLTVTEADEDKSYCFYCYKSGSLSADDVLTWQLELGSTASPYAPYTGQSYPVTFPALGKNLVNQADGKTSNSNWWIGSDKFNEEPDGTFVLDAGTYTFSASETQNGFYVRCNGVTVKTVYNNTKATFTLTEKAPVRLMLYKQGVTAEYWNTINIQLETGDTATAYEPYMSTYGGTLDAVNGVLMVEWTTVTFDGSQPNNKFGFDTVSSTIEPRNRISWVGIYSEDGGIVGGKYISDKLIGDASYVQNPSIWHVSNSGSAVARMFIGVPTTITSVAEWQTYVTQNPITVAYKLATPIEIQLDPIAIQTMLGDNTIWSDVNGNIELDYRADTKLFCQKNDSVDDVRVNGTSVLNNGVANIPLANGSTWGAVKIGSGLYVGETSGVLQTNRASSAQIKAATNNNNPIVPQMQHESIFYGLAKLAGADMSSSSNAVGTFTPEAIVAIQKMLGVYQPPFELIRNITLSERSSVIITTDDDGLPLNLMSLFMEITYPANLESETAGYGRYMFYDNSGSSACLMAETTKYTTNSNATFKLLELSCKANMKFLRYTTQTTTGYHGAWYSKAIYTSGPRSMLLDYGNIARIAMNSSDYEPAGTQIRIWGQRAY